MCIGSTAPLDFVWIYLPSPYVCLASVFTSLAPQVVIQRLEVEAELKRSHKTCHALQPPALDLSMTEKDLSGVDHPSMPKEFLCPVSMRLMTDPVVTPAGITYDR